MGKSIVQKVLESHLTVGEYRPGEEIGIKVDQTLTQDATGTMTYLQFEAMDVEKIRTDLSVSYVDHNTVQLGFENADDHKYLKTVAAKYGIVYSRAGNGICHQVHLERFGKPGTTLLGADSHTTTGGGIGQVAIGAGGLDVALAMAGEPFYMTCPRGIRINLTGKLKPWVSAKDVILKVLDIFSTRGNVGCAFEYGGAGVGTLSVPERATITNMGAECGVTTSVFPSDDETRRFLRAQDREADWKPIDADNNAEYSRTVDLNLSEIIPLAATPHSPGNISTVEALEGMRVDQVCIGSCTSSSYRDLMLVAQIMKGKRVHPDVSLVLAPGSRQVLDMIAKNGALADLIESGVRLAECACGFCIGNGQSPQSGGISLRTSNRNFEGRSGTQDAKVYLVSPETAVAAAIKGQLVDPRSLGIEYPKVEMPTKFMVDDSMIIPPPANPESVRVFRGPNIGEPPRSEKLPENIIGVITIKVGDKITTDHIIPAGARLKYRSNVPKYSEYLFETVDPKFHERAREVKNQSKHNIIVGGASYGQGSSREHAAMCPMFLGVKAVITKSFERIHSANLVNFGILPLTFTSESDYDRVKQDDNLEVIGVRETLRRNLPIIVKNKTQGFDFEVKYELSDRQRDIILAGGTLSYVKTK
ncbi:MAG: aconitate hydratase [archaeon]